MLQHHVLLILSQKKKNHVLLVWFVAATGQMSGVTKRKYVVLLTLKVGGKTSICMDAINQRMVLIMRPQPQLF